MQLFYKYQPAISIPVVYYNISSIVACLRTSSVKFLRLEKFIAFSIAIDAYKAINRKLCPAVFQNIWISHDIPQNAVKVTDFI